MTTTTDTQTLHVEESAGAPSWRHWLGRVAPIGPLAMAGWSLAVPYALLDEPAVWIPKMAAEARVELAFAMMLLFCLTIGVGVIVTGLVARRGSPKLGTAGLVLAYFGFAAMGFGGIAYDAIAASSLRAGVDIATIERVLEQADGFLAPTIGAMVFIPLSFLGTLLLGIALWRGRTVPRWTAGLLLAAFPVILAGGAVLMALNAAGFVMMAVAFGVAGRAFSRQE